MSPPGAGRGGGLSAPERAVHPWALSAPGERLDTELGERLDTVRRRIARSDPRAGEVTVLAVTKGFSPAVAEQAAAAGLVDLGENYAAELCTKARALDRAHPEGRSAASGVSAVRWHFLGAIQRNKVRGLAPHVHLWQSVARLEEGEAIARWAPGAAVLVQVAPEGSGRGRNGCSPESAAGLVSRLRHLGLEVRGLMVVGRRGPPEASRPGFRVVAELAQRLELADLSMGMSDDLEVAVEEGATMVRLGRALFGNRPPA